MKTLAMGFFDGVHIAHQKIIKSAVAYGIENNMPAAAVTFDRSPAEVLFSAKVSLLSDNREKQRLISALGAECIMLGASRKLFAMSGEEFVKEVLLKQLEVGAVFCGYNYTFGSDLLKCGDLKRLGDKYGFKVFVAEEERIGEESVSSSRIRELLQKGNTEAAAELLGRRYSIGGIVEGGKRLGRTMGFPTINIYPQGMRAEIPNGVYATYVTFNGERHVGVTNVGTNPTVGDGNLRIETFIPNYSGNLYGVWVNTEFVHFVRPERKFSSVEELFERIGKDTEYIVEMMK